MLIARVHGLALGKRAIEMRGFSINYLTHVVQDTIIFTFVVIALSHV